MAPTTGPIPTLHDPLAEAASIPAEMVVAALSSPDGTVRVLSGTALGAYVSALVQSHFDAVQPAWIDAAADMAAGAVRAATAEQVARWTQQLEAAGRAARWEALGGQDAFGGEPELVRRNLWLPRGLANTFKASASAQGISQQDAFTEALQLWITSRGSAVA